MKWNFTKIVLVGNANLYMGYGKASLYPFYLIEIEILMETTLQKTYLVIFSHIAILYFGFFTSQR
jgi:hypothetical protein